MTGTGTNAAGDLIIDTEEGSYHMLPQGYKMGLRWMLAEMLMPDYGRSDQAQMEMVMRNAARFRGAIKRANMYPQPTATVDPALMGGRINDPGWFLNGGFN